MNVPLGRCYVQEYCSDDGRASFLVPQIDSEGDFTRWIWVEVCRHHWDGWWDDDWSGLKPSAYKLSDIKKLTPAKEVDSSKRKIRKKVKR